MTQSAPISRFAATGCLVPSTSVVEELSGGPSMANFEHSGRRWHCTLPLIRWCLEGWYVRRHRTMVGGAYPSSLTLPSNSMARTSLMPRFPAAIKRPCPAITPNLPLPCAIGETAPKNCNNLKYGPTPAAAGVLRHGSLVETDESRYTLSTSTICHNQLPF